jgi:uncharacterized protein YcfJ
MRHHMTTKIPVIGALLCALALMLAGCTQPLTTREKSTLAGGGLGAATGAIIGATTGSPGAGAAIGGALGAIAGAVTADQLQAQDNLLVAQQREIDELRRKIRAQQEKLDRLAREHE